MPDPTPAWPYGQMDELQQTLDRLMLNENDEKRRYDLVIHAMDLARQKGYDVGIRIDHSKPEWPVIYIELPTGQVSWHIPQHRHEYDGHSPEEKFVRINSYVLPIVK